ncbi:hypothetical protein F511_39055 [Dorcoceras hygrometricum]|uniref:CCHC-type domain-containing protein n=1 Tax=Dorcoceras hygrometricum TaxID=472368 RepID=A0A2Z7ATU2_9LAMI|nr:hypothetical protein F511_39055 [Dorcoceras hygrometricum]
MHSQSASGNHRSMIFRCDNQPTITTQWYSSTTAQQATTSMIALDLSSTTTQQADHNSSSIRTSIKFRLNIALSSSKSKLRSVRNHLPKAAQERKNHRTTIAKISNSATTSCSLNSSIQVSKLVSIERSKEDELSDTNIAPNGGVNRRQYHEIWFDEHKSESYRDTLATVHRTLSSPIADGRQLRLKMPGLEAERVTPVTLISLLGSVTMVSPLVVELIQLVVPREGRGRGQFQEEYEGQSEEVQRSVPRRGRDRQVEIEVDELAARVDDMELKKSGSSSSGSGSYSSGSSSKVDFCGQCGGRHPTAQRVGGQGSCNVCGQYGHFARVCPLAGSQHTATPPQGRGGSSRGRSFPAPQQRLGEPQYRLFQQPGPSRFGQSS